MTGRSPADIRRAQRFVVALLVVADIVLALLVSARFFLRADLSRNGVYSLSATTKTMVAGLPEPLNITYYVSDALRTGPPSLLRSKIFSTSTRHGHEDA